MTNQLIESIVFAVFGLVIAAVGAVTNAGLEIIVLGGLAFITAGIWIWQTLANK